MSSIVSEEKEGELPDIARTILLLASHRIALGRIALQLLQRIALQQLLPALHCHLLRALFIFPNPLPSTTLSLSSKQRSTLPPSRHLLSLAKERTSDFTIVGKLYCTSDCIHRLDNLPQHSLQRKEHLLHTVVSDASVIADSRINSGREWMFIVERSSCC